MQASPLIKCIQRLTIVIVIQSAIWSVASSVRFAAPSNYPLDYTDLLLVTNFDNDQHQDVVVASSDMVYVLFSDGLGGFTRTNSYGGGYVFSSIAAGDVNNDSQPDLVVLDSSLNTLRIYRGTNDYFATPLVHQISSSAHAVALADFNKDNRVDYVTANGGAENITVFFGNGNGGFLAAGQNHSVTGLPYWVTSADVDSDGNKDVVTCNIEGNQVSVLYGLGNGGFGPAVYLPVGISPRGVAVGDFNGDTKPDLASANAGNNTVSVLLQTGIRVFGPATNYPVANLPYSIAVNDLNGDGILDLATANYSSSDVVVLLGKGDGKFTFAGSFLTGGSASSIGLADMNHDGQVDILTANNSLAASLSQLRNQSRVSLQIAAQGPNVKLWWPAYAVGATLQGTSNLLAVTNWQTVTNAPFGEGDYNAVSIPRIHSQRYFRLKLD